MGIPDANSVPANQKKDWSQVKGDIFYSVIKIKYYYRFESNQDCYKISDELLTPRCPAPRIAPVSLCATSIFRFPCSGDARRGLVAMDSYKKYLK